MKISQVDDMVEEFEPKFTEVSVKDDLVNSINNFLKDLLTQTQVEGIIIPNLLPNGDTYIPALITSPDRLTSANPLAPLMPVNASKAVMDFTRLTPSQKLVGVILKPCESRALVELVKLKQVNIDNLLIIVIDCPGTFSVKNHEVENNNTLLDIFKTSKSHKDLRSACTACEQFSPGYGDIIIGLYGQDLKKEYLVGVNSILGLESVEPLKLDFDKKIDKSLESRDNAIEKLLGTRKKIVSEMVENTEKDIKGVDNFMSVLSSCINCHNCMTVCPICYCKECFFDSPTFDLESDKYFQMAEYKGALRLPSNMFLFHVTRFNHMVLSCVACGMCEQGCPADIPLLSIYKTVGKNAQKVFDYEPGRSLEEDIPILTFKEDELEPR
jgi:formate dehydrogenase subunit beta